ncbi:hypothetical protein BV25DRAFT_1990055 [Artomyces pyxidatus]|uniref:Uncharacterized protein n=1 Tax=Artomyces pyxidatus TaxID=48021 RepID=A0ACB8T8N2_9AGAM|nr:hypothetical protein BV25DRAFT_1990055 [Artomyces pyxidatus]
MFFKRRMTSTWRSCLSYGFQLFRCRTDFAASPRPTSTERVRRRPRESHRTIIYPSLMPPSVSLADSVTDPSSSLQPIYRFRRAVTNVIHANQLAREQAVHEGERTTSPVGGSPSLSTHSRDGSVSSRKHSHSRKSSKSGPVDSPSSPVAYGQFPRTRPHDVDLPIGRSNSQYLSPPQHLFEGSGIVVTVQDPSTEYLPRRVTDRPEPPAGRAVSLIYAAEVTRYVRKHNAQRKFHPHTIQPMTTYFPHLRQVGDSVFGDWTIGDWTPVTHPEGALYFYHRRRRIYTDVDLFDPDSRREIEAFAQYLDDRLEADARSLPSDECEVVLDCVRDEETGLITWSYYYVDHTTRTLFWLDVYDASNIISDVMGVMSPSHIKHRIEAQYWYHWSLYPEGPHELPSTAYDELLGILSFGCMDTLTSRTSTLPFSAEEMQVMIGLTRDAKATGPECIPLTTSVARILSVFAHWRYLYFHGQNAARLQQDTNVYGDVEHPRSILIAIWSPVLFFAPEVHLKEIEQLWEDRIIVTTLWRNLVEKLQSEWQDFILLATVMLTVDVGFLAIPGVVVTDNGSPTGATSQAQIACYLSIAMSAGSIIMGLLLVRHNREISRHQSTGPLAVEYMSRNNHSLFGLEPLAIIFSIPYALLMWAMISFVVSFFLLCFRLTSFPTRVSVGVGALAVLGLVMWCIRHVWESGDRGGQVWVSTLELSMIGLSRSVRAQGRRLRAALRRRASASPII